MEKQCSKCKLIKSTVDFSKSSKEKSGLRNRCKTCVKEDDRIYGVKNKNKKKISKQKWRKENREKFNATARAWNKKNKHVISWRAMLRRTLAGKKKTNKTEALMGYGAEDFKNHIESLWKEGMSWDNYGEWHVDHIIPLAQFPPDTPPSIVNALKNLRPLWAPENLSRPRNDAPPIEKRPYTIFLDIDGSLVYHHGTLSEQMNKLELLPGVKEKFEEWDKKGYNIILTTGRRESLRTLTENQLHDLGLFWDHLLMGIGGGQRIIVNDLKPNSCVPTAIAINLKRNEGLETVNIEDATRIQTLALFYGVNI